MSEHLPAGLPADDAPGPAGDPDVIGQVLRHIARLLELSPGPLRRLRVRSGRVSVELEWPQGWPGPTTALPGAPGLPGQPVPPGMPGPATDPAGPGAPVPDPAAEPNYLRAPMVGTFYHAPEPGAAPFVRAGDLVEEGQQIGILEAMKLMNPIEADRAGRVVRIVVPDGEPVQYDQPLIELGDPT